MARWFGSGKNSATVARNRCVAEFRPARFQSPSAANWAAPARDQIFRRAIFCRRQKYFHLGQMKSFHSRPDDLPTNRCKFFRRQQRDVRAREIFRAAGSTLAWSSPRRPASWSREPEFAERSGVWSLASGEFMVRSSGFRLSALDARLFSAPVSIGDGPRTSSPGRGGTAASGAVHVAHDVFDRARLAVFVRGNLFAEFQPPFRQADAITNGGVKFAIVTQRENRRGRRGRTIVAEKGHAQSVVATVLVDRKPRIIAGWFIAARSSGPSVRRSKNRQPERSRNCCSRRFRPGCFSAR